VTMRRTLRTLAVLALLAPVAAGCSSGSAETGDTDTGPTSTSTPSATPRTKAVRFAECMRDKGVPEFPDPDASGELTIDAVVNGSSLDPSSAAWKGAIGACKDLQPSGFTGRKRSSDQQEAALEFAQCIRENGVQDFPDPAPGQPLVDTNRIPSTDGEGGMDVLNAAMRTCGDALAGRLGVTRT
jgi:hypothetical protein